VKAVVLVGGEGTRLRPLTETRPKPLLPFMDRPFLHHVLDHLGRHGVQEAILSSPYLEEEFRSFLEDRSGAPAATWVHESEPLGTCGAIVGALPLLDGTFLVCNGDILTDLDLTSLVRAHRERGAVATIALTRVEDARPYGLVETDEEGRVAAFREKPEQRVAGWVNAGTYVLEPAALEGTPEGIPVSIERETFPSLIARGDPVLGVFSSAYWRDLGTPESYLDAHLDALAGLVSGVRVAAPFIGVGAEVAPGAAVSETVVVGTGARVEAGAVLKRSVLHERCRVDRDAKVEGSIVGRDARVGAGAIIASSVLGDGAALAPGARIEGARVPPGAAIS
jgi:mannose-1-phosphate guanylyltransferase